MTRPWEETEREDRAASLQRTAGSLHEHLNSLIDAQSPAGDLGWDLAVAVGRNEVPEDAHQQITQARAAMREAIASYSKAVEGYFTSLESLGER